MSQVGQSGSHTHKYGFFQVTIVTIILVKMKVENNVPHLQSLARSWSAIQYRHGMAHIKMCSLTYFNLPQFFSFELLFKLCS